MSDNRFLTTFFSLLDLLDTCTFSLPKTGHTAAALPLRFCPRPSKCHAKGLLLDPGGDYSRFTQFLLLSIFSIVHLPFPITPIHNSVRPPFSSFPLLTFVINWSDQHLNRYFLISCRIYIHQRTSSPSYKLEQDREELREIIETGLGFLLLLFCFVFGGGKRWCTPVMDDYGITCLQGKLLLIFVS